MTPRDIGPDRLDPADVLMVLRRVATPEQPWAQTWQIRQWIEDNWQPYESADITGALIGSRLRALKREGKVDTIWLRTRRGRLLTAWQEEK